MSLIDENPNRSQRDLAQELGVSVGKLNYCLRALMDRGYVKAKNFRHSQKKRAYIYVLTPAGIESRLRQTRKFLEYKQREYRVVKAEIKRLSAELARATETDAS